MKNNLFNLDLVGAKTGKMLTKKEKAIQHLVNLILSRMFQITMICIIAFLVLTVLRFIYKIWI